MYKVFCSIKDIPTDQVSCTLNILRKCKSSPQKNQHFILNRSEAFPPQRYGQTGKHCESQSSFATLNSPIGKNSLVTVSTEFFFMRRLHLGSRIILGYSIWNSKSWSCLGLFYYLPPPPSPLLNSIINSIDMLQNLPSLHHKLSMIGFNKSKIT